MPIVTIRMTDDEKEALQKLAKFENLNLSNLIKKYIFEKLEDEYDLKVAEKSYEEYLKNPVTYTHEELCELLEIEK